MIDQFSGEYRFLSNFYPATVTGPSGFLYTTAEAAYQAFKTTDPMWHGELARRSNDPAFCKKLGRSARLRSDWDTFRHYAMRGILADKFRSASLLVPLLATIGQDLIEGNIWHDNYWGDCRCGRPACADKGTNWLGHYLMILRDKQ